MYTNRATQYAHKRYDNMKNENDSMIREMVYSTIDGCMRVLAVWLFAFAIWACITLFFGCSRVSSEHVEQHSNVQSDVDVTSVSTTGVAETSSSETKNNENTGVIFSHFFDDSLDASVKVTEYGADGQTKRVTEATLHRGRKGSMSGAVQRESSSAQCSAASSQLSDSIRVSASARCSDVRQVSHVVERRSWFQRHWKMVLAIFATAVMVAIAVWKRRRWIHSKLVRMFFLVY